MQLTERHRVKRNNEMFKACDAICFASKNIYNRSLYLIKQDWEQRQSYDVLNNLNEVMKKEECFQAIPCNVAQQTIRMVQKVYKSFFKLIKEKEDGKIPKEQEVNEPSYLNKTKGRYVAQYTPRVISKKHFQKRGVVKLSQIDIEVKTKVKRYEDIALVRVVPKNDEYYIEVVYNVEDTPQLKSNRTYAAIDLGVNNLATITFSKKGKQPLIVNGRPLKSINQYYNKKLAKLKSTLEVRNKQKSSHATRKLAAKRNNKVNDFMHKASRRIVNLLVKDDIRTLIIGKNDGWKQEVDMKRQNNQSFVSIPHSRFVEMLSYKCEQKGIRVMLVEESYTSKASFLDLDPLPKHGEGEAPTFSGYRESRGLYKRKGVKERVNSDVNGSYNIMRKAIPTFFNKGIEGVVVRPLVLNVSRQTKTNSMKNIEFGYHPIVEYIKNSWKEHRNNSDKKNTFAVNRYIFPQIADMLSDCKDIAFISISETKDCIEYNKFEDYGHYLNDSENVLNIDFDDLEKDLDVDGFHFKSIAEEQARQIYDFLIKHSDKHIICHCRAGKSRSAAISEFLLQMFPDKYEECNANWINSDKTPNGEVLRQLKRIYYLNH